MRKCAVCGHESDAETCPRCGEASWLAVEPKHAVNPEPKAEADEAPSSEPKPKKRGRK